MFKRSLLLLTFIGSLGFSATPLWAARVVSLLPSNTEVLESIGAGHEVVGVTRFDGLLKRSNAVVNIGDFMHPNVERIVTLQPDLIVAGYWTSSHIVPRLAQMGFKVVQIKNPTSIEEIYQSIRDLAQAVGRPASAEPVIENMKRRFKKVETRARTHKRWKTYIEIDSPYWTVGGRDFLSEALKRTGIDNIFFDLERQSAQVSPELIVERKPDLIITFRAKRAEVVAREGWGNIPAVQQGAIIDDFSEDVLSRPSPALAVGMEELAARLERLEKP